MAQTARPPYRNTRDAFESCLWSAEEVAEEQAIWPYLGGADRWARDPDVGLVERSYTVSGRVRDIDFPGGRIRMPGGIGGSSVTATIGDDGARRRSSAPEGVAPRINSYGDSFTHGDQVNDGETWQEYLGAHLLEPIRNFGLGGGSVYQTYLRMVKEETGPNAAPYILFYIWGDDHLRSIVSTWVQRIVGSASRFASGNPTIGYDLGTRSIVEHECWLPDRKSLERLADLDWQTERLGDDLVTQLFLVGGHPNAGRYGTPVRRIQDFDEDAVCRLADGLGVDWNNGDLFTRIHAVLDRFSLKASIHVIEKARRFAQETGKKIMFLLFDPFRAVPSLVEDGTRYDQLIVDHLQATGAEFFDMTQLHVDDIRSRSGTYEEFCERYFVNGFGHYSPAGNHFFAFALKDRVVHWLDSKPVPYHDPGEPGPDDYLFNGRFGATLDR